jgi:hypothetical protein
MERGDGEKLKAKPEADYVFDPVSASADAWKTYLLNPKNFEKDFARGEFPFVAPASTILERIREASTPRSVIETAVQTVLENWDEVAEPKFFREINPIEFVASLADESSVDVVQKLWKNAPKNSIFLQQGLRQAAEGLGVHVPLDQEELEKLYIEQFDTYGFTALEIMLKRGEVGRAAALFEEQVDRYSKGNDPVMLDRLVSLGLPATSAKKWLDQSANKGPGYEPWYREALERWGYTSE